MITKKIADNPCILCIYLKIFFQSELFGATTQKKEATANLRMPYFLEKEAAHCDYLVLWLDCDKEGENICFEVIDCVKNSMNRARPNEQVQSHIGLEGKAESIS